MSFSSDWLNKQKDKKNDNVVGGSEGLFGMSSASRKLFSRVSEMGEGLGLISSGSAVTLSTDGELADGPQPGNEGSSMSYGERFKGFAATLASSACFFMIALTFLPTVIIFPGKFALAFTVGSMLFMSSFALLIGPKKFFASLFTKDRASFSALYFGSLLMTLYSVFVAKRYLFVLGSAFAQIASLLWYAASYIPGGKYGLKVLSKMCVATARKVAGPCLSFCGVCFEVCCKACAGNGGGGSTLPL